MTEPSDERIERLFYLMDERKHPSDYEIQLDLSEEAKTKLRIAERFQNFIEGRKSVLNPKFWSEWQEKPPTTQNGCKECENIASLFNLIV